jgi:predicted transcriptional regulator
MDVNAHFNSQFVMMDFELLDNPEFMRFVGSTAFSVYLVLRRYVWRSEEREHSAGLHQLYAHGFLTSSVSVAALAERIGVSDRSVKEATTRLERLGIVQSRVTGREKVYTLGEWVDISEQKDGSVRKEWFYLERVFAARGEEIFTSEVQVEKDTGRHEEKRPAEVQESACTNREENKESVNALPKQEKDSAHVCYVVEEILKVCGDQKSRAFYTKLATLLPDTLIFRSLSEIVQDPTIRNRGAVLTSKLAPALISG